jgi:hypothetical protein
MAKNLSTAEAANRYRLLQAATLIRWHKAAQAGAIPLPLKHDANGQIELDADLFIDDLGEVASTSGEPI